MLGPITLIGTQCPESLVVDDNNDYNLAIPNKNESDHMFNENEP